MVGRDGVGDFLEDDRFAGFRRRGNQASLPSSDRGQQIHCPGGGVLVVVFEFDFFLRIERRQVVE